MYLIVFRWCNSRKLWIKRSPGLLRLHGCLCGTLMEPTRHMCRDSKTVGGGPWLLIGPVCILKIPGFLPEQRRHSRHGASLINNPMLMLNVWMLLVSGNCRGCPRQLRHQHRDPRGLWGQPSTRTAADTSETTPRDRRRIGERNCRVWRPVQPWPLPAYPLPDQAKTS